jgi:hypothetical protein
VVAARPDEPRRPTPGRVIARMLRRAAPRVITTCLLLTVSGVAASMTTGALASVLDWVCFVLLALAVAGPRRWWRYVKYGKPAVWRLDHEGSVALFVTDPGPNRIQVAAHLREHGPLDLGEALKRADNPSRPVWEDLTSESADRMGAILKNAGAAVRVGPRPSPSWARDVTDR